MLLAAPRWTVEAPAPVAEKLVSAPFEATTSVAAIPADPVRHSGESRNPAPASEWVPASAGMTAAGANDEPMFPVALLLLLTLAALFSLVGLRRGAHVLVEHDWLSALAQAQRRMGFKQCTALLASHDIASPVSWGVLRPVILLNEGAIGVPAQAEAIIAGYVELAISGEHAVAVAALPNRHRDPFDRMLVAQGLIESVPLLTADDQLIGYPGDIRRV